MTELSRRAYLAATGIAATGTVGLAGCSERAAATGTLATQVTDQPGDISDFDSCVVTIQGIWVKPGDGETDGDGSNEDDDGVNETDSDGSDTVDNETTADNETQADNETTADDETQADSEATADTADNETQADRREQDESDADESDADESDADESDGREYHEFDEPQEADLVELQDGNTKLIDERDLEVRTYEYLQLDVSNVDGVLASGEEADVDTPGNAPLQFKEPFEIREGETTTFVGDFTPVRRGQTGRYLLQPVAQGTQVTYE